MPKKKEVLEVWARSWRGCVRKIRNDIKDEGEFYDDIELFQSAEIGVQNSMEVDEKEFKHLRITIEEL